MNYILDTNILLTYSRENKISQKVEADLNLFQTGNNLIVSVVTVGEIESILLRSKLGGKRSLVIEKMLSQVAVLDINIEELIKTTDALKRLARGNCHLVRLLLQRETWARMIYGFPLQLQPSILPWSQWTGISIIYSKSFLS